MLCRLDDHHRTDGTGESVFTAVVVQTDANADVGCGQLNVAAIWTACSNGCHVRLPHFAYKELFGPHTKTLEDRLDYFTSR
jgi:hypothetical protein